MMTACPVGELVGDAGSLVEELPSSIPHLGVGLDEIEKRAEFFDGARRIRISLCDHDVVFVVARIDGRLEDSGLSGGESGRGAAGGSLLPSSAEHAATMTSSSPGGPMATTSLVINDW